MSADELYMQFLPDILVAGNKHLARKATREREANIESMYVRVLSELCMNRFKWTGLPDTIDERWLELTIMQKSFSLFYFDDAFDMFMAMPATASGERNMMDQPVSYTVQATAAYPGRDIKMNDGIPIWANYYRTSDLDIVYLYAKKLANIDRSIEINAKNARRTRIVTTNKDQRLTAANVNNLIDEGESTVFVNESFDPMSQMTSFDVGINPDNLEKLHIVRVREWNTAVGLLGINNANQDKKERLVADEVAANDEQVTAMKQVNLNSRRRACRLINKRFGLNVWCDFYTDEFREEKEDEEYPDERI